MKSRIKNKAPNRKPDVLPGVIIPTNILSDPPIQSMINEFGPESLALLVSVMAACGGSQKAMLHEDLMPSCFSLIGMEVEDAVPMIEWCIKFKLLIEVEVDSEIYFTTDALQLNLEKLIKDRTNWRKKKNTSKGNPQGIQGESKETPRGIQGEPAENLNLKLNLNLNPNVVPKVLHGSYVYLSEAEEIKLLDEIEPEVLNKAIEKLDAWIGSDPTPKKIRNGKNGAATLRSWVIGEVTGLGKGWRSNGKPKRDLDTEIKEFLNEGN